MPSMVVAITAVTGKTADQLRGCDQRAALRLERAMWVWAFRIMNTSKALAPWKTSNMKNKIVPKQTARFEFLVGTNARSKPSNNWPQGYPYAILQEFDESLFHPHGQAAFMRTGLARTRRKGVRLCQRAVAGALSRKGKDISVQMED